MTEANDVLSQRALSLADDAERERAGLSKKLGDELEDVKKKLREAEEDADEERGRGQGQRIQLLDEVCPASTPFPVFLTTANVVPLRGEKRR